MKKAITICGLLCIVFISCRHHDTSITYRDTDRYYTMKAHFNKSKTRRVEYYLERNLGSSAHYSFINSNLNDMLVTDDHGKFYMNKNEGLINIKLDKRHNSRETYYKVRSICEGMKDVLSE